MFLSAFVGFMLLAVFVSFEMGRKIHWSIGLALGVLLISGGYSFFLPKFYPIPVNPMSMARIGGEVLYSISVLLLFSFMLLSQSKKFFERCLSILFYVAALDSVALIIGYLFFRNPNISIEPHGIMFNKTADVSFIVCLLPLAFKKGWAYIVPMITAIVISKSNTAVAGIGVAIAFYLLPKMNFKNWVMIMFPITAAFLLTARFALGDHFIADSGRKFVWLGSLHFYDQFSNHLIGIGTGTFSFWGPAWQLAHYNQPGVGIWNWMHCEPLEILFENGILGLGTSLIAFGYLLKKSFSNYAFPVACVYGFTCLTEMPLRLFITQLLGVSLLAVAFKRNANNVC